MNKTLLMLTALCSIALAAPAFSADKVTTESKTSSKVEKSNDGSYSVKKSASSERDDSASGTSSSETDVKASRDANGNTEKTVTKKVIDDPNGLGNKTTTKIKDTVKNKDGSTKVSHKKTVNGKTVEDTTEEQDNQ